MSEKPQMQPNQVFIHARIDHQKLVNNKYFTDVTAPAVDSFSRPSRFTLRSDKQLGQDGMMISHVCMLSGYLKEFSFTEKGTGIRKNGTEMTCTLDVIA